MSSAPPPPPFVATDGDMDFACAADGRAAPAVRTAKPSWWRIGAMGAAGLAGCAYVAFFDPNTSTALYPSCPFKVMTGLDCPGCGITRALHALATGNVGRALDHNLLFVIALPVLLWWMVRGVIGTTDRPTRTPLFVWRTWMTWAIVGTLGTFWVLRNLPLAPFEWLAAAA